MGTNNQYLNFFIFGFKPFAAVRATNQITTAIKQQEWNVKV